MYRAMPGSRLEIFPETGHFPHHADPARFLEVMRDFLRTTQPGDYSRAQWRAVLCSGMGRAVSREPVVAAAVRDAATAGA